MASNIITVASATSIKSKFGSTEGSTDAAGTSFTTVLEGHLTAWEAIKHNFTPGAPSSILSSLNTGVPNTGLFLESYRERYQILDSAKAGGAVQPGVVEVTLVFKDSNLLNAGGGDGAGAPTPVPVYEIEWVPSEITLAGHSVRYPNLKDTVSGFGSFYDLFVGYINGSDKDRNRIGASIVGLPASAGKNQLYDITNAWRQGIESKRMYHPILTKTTTRNSSPDIEEIGMIDTPPAGFGSLKPSGYTYVKTAHRVARTGRVGAYNEVEQWEGFKFVPTALYGTASEQSTVPTAP